MSMFLVFFGFAVVIAGAVVWGLWESAKELIGLGLVGSLMIAFMFTLLWAIGWVLVVILGGIGIFAMWVTSYQ